MMREDIFPEVEVDKVDKPVAPDWWPEGKPAERLDNRHVYPDQDGDWRTHLGVILNRKERRRLGIPTRAKMRG